MTIASLFPALIIPLLYRFRTTLTRIRIAISLTGLLDVTLRVTMNANLKEIFGATAA